jgi:hypothetical protein
VRVKSDFLAKLRTDTWPNVDPPCCSTTDDNRPLTIGRGLRLMTERLPDDASQLSPRIICRARQARVPSFACWQIRKQEQQRKNLARRAEGRQCIQDCEPLRLGSRRNAGKREIAIIRWVATHNVTKRSDELKRFLARREGDQYGSPDRLRQPVVAPTSQLQIGNLR